MSTKAGSDVGSMPRVRIEAVVELLARNRPVACEDASWPSGQVRISAYLGSAELPRSVTRGVRCLVVVGDQIVVCENAHGFVHPWPGGGRQEEETFIEAARREVHEETGWLIDQASFRRLGWLHIENLSPVPADHPYPYPDCLYVVGVATAERRDHGRDGEWSDTEGYELRSWLVPLVEAHDHVQGDALSLPFLDVVRQQAGSR